MKKNKKPKMAIVELKALFPKPEPRIIKRAATVNPSRKPKSGKITPAQYRRLHKGVTNSHTTKS